MAKSPATAVDRAAPGRRSPFVLIFFVGLGSLGAIIYQTNPELFNTDGDNQVALATSGDPATTHSDTKAKTETKADNQIQYFQEVHPKNDQTQHQLFVPINTTRRVFREHPTNRAASGHPKEHQKAAARHPAGSSDRSGR